MAPRFLLTRQEAAESLGMSLSHFQRHVQPHIPCVYSGQLRLYRPRDLEQWAEREACVPAEPSTRRPASAASSNVRPALATAG
jgi:hypothetical protein